MLVVVPSAVGSVHELVPGLATDVEEPTARGRVLRDNEIPSPMLEVPLNLGEDLPVVREERAPQM